VLRSEEYTIFSASSVLYDYYYEERLQKLIDQIITATNIPKPTIPPPITKPSYILSSLYVDVGVGVGSTGVGVGVGVGSGVGIGIVPFDVSFEGMVSLLGMTGAVSLSYLLPR